jgi:hypothetical protein
MPRSAIISAEPVFSKSNRTRIGNTAAAYSSSIPFVLRCHECDVLHDLVVPVLQLLHLLKLSVPLYFQAGDFRVFFLTTAANTARSIYSIKLHKGTVCDQIPC